MKLTNTLSDDQSILSDNPSQTGSGYPESHAEFFPVHTTYNFPTRTY